VEIELPDELSMLRDMVRRFVDEELIPIEGKSLDGQRLKPEIEARLIARCKELGLWQIDVPKELGGQGLGVLGRSVVWSELGRTVALPTRVVRILGPDIRAPLYALEGEMRERYLMPAVRGERESCFAQTEPDAGSDPGAMRTTAVRDGDDWIINGAKTFITGGMQADLVIVVARTATDPDNRRKGLTLFVVEDGMEGFTRGRELEKMGCKVQDTAELSFVDVRVPAANMLGEEGEAFGYLGHNLPQERLTVAVGSVSQARSAITAAIDYTKGRKAFGTPVSSFQNTKFELAACSAEVEAAQAMLDRAVSLHVEGELSPADAARVKLFCTEMQQRVIDRCLQLFGGYGYMMEYPIARLYTAARVARIYAGTSEVMKVIIAKSLGL